MGSGHHKPAFLASSQVLQAAGMGATGENLLLASRPGPAAVGRAQALLNTDGPRCSREKQRGGVTCTQLASTSFGFVWHSVELRF